MSPRSMIQDSRLRTFRLISREDKQVSTLNYPPRREGEALRRVTHMGRLYAEQDGSGYYGDDVFVEVTEEAAA